MHATNAVLYRETVVFPELLGVHNNGGLLCSGNFCRKLFTL